MSRDVGLAIFVFALVALPLELLHGFGMCLSPGWSRGWPGIPQPTAMVIGFGVMTVAIPITMAALLAPLCVRLGEKRNSKRYGTACFAAALATALVIGGLLAIVVCRFVAQRV